MLKILIFLYLRLKALCFDECKEIRKFAVDKIIYSRANIEESKRRAIEKAPQSISIRLLFNILL